MRDGDERLLLRALPDFESRVVFEQAKGVIAAEHGIGIDEAFKMLREHARARNASLHDVAEAVVNLGPRL